MWYDRMAKTSVEVLKIELDGSQEYLLDLITTMNEFPESFEPSVLKLKRGVLMCEVADELLKDWFNLNVDNSLFNLKCVIDFSKTFPRIILYETYLHEFLDDNIQLSDLKYQNGLFLIQDENGVSRLAGCVSKVNDFIECKGLIILWTRNVLLAFSRRLTERGNKWTH